MSKTLTSSTRTSHISAISMLWRWSYESVVKTMATMRRTLQQANKTEDKGRTLIGQHFYEKDTAGTIVDLPVRSGGLSEPPLHALHRGEVHGLGSGVLLAEAWWHRSKGGTDTSLLGSMEKRIEDMRRRGADRACWRIYVP